MVKNHGTLITATSIHVLTPTSVYAISTKLTSVVLACVLVRLSHPVATVTPGTVPITYTMAHATHTDSASVVLAIALVVEN